VEMDSLTSITKVESLDEKCKGMDRMIEETEKKILELNLLVDGLDNSKLDKKSIETYKQNIEENVLKMSYELED
jgi:predicted RNase H-like nuclease (RuvC/YqgF family)